MIIAPVSVAHVRLPWREPLDMLARFADEAFSFALLSDGSAAERWSYVGRAPTSTFRDIKDLRRALDGASRPCEPDLPPFHGGAVGIASYEWSSTFEPSAPQARRVPAWPDLAGGVYESLAAFDHRRREVWAIGRGADREQAAARADRVAADVQAARPVHRVATAPATVEACRWAAFYPEAVAEVIAAIGAGEIFQANIARGWAGRLGPGVGPFELLNFLHAFSPAPLAGYMRLPGAALVSRSPERFLSVTPEGVALTSPIKGTRPRGQNDAEDAHLAQELLGSAKDRAENLMIVDVMRNDLARACVPGSVKVEAFCALQSFSNVHHLTSTISGRLAPGEDALSVFASAFPPGSVTGAPKLQAMKVIARHEPPRGPYCGSLFRAGFDGSFDSNVLIRSIALDLDADEGWRWEARAGAGITAESDPYAEDAEAVQKARAVLAGFAS